MRTMMFAKVFRLVPSASLLTAAVVNAEPTAEQLAFFESRVRPVLKENCYRCHSLEVGKSKGDLTLDTRDGWTKGGKNGAVIEPGAPEKSALIAAIGYENPDLQMPPKGEKLTAQQIADLTEWVKMGAPDPRKGNGAIAGKLSGLTDKARAHWAYQPVKNPAPPAVKNSAWLGNPAFPKSFNPIDAFILKKLEDAHIAPAPPADRETLLRRATYDLTGLPPTPAEVDAFLTDASPNAFEKVVDRLLASPHYGERWGRYWLDTARYSDTTGGPRNAQKRGQDYRYAYAWTYRDYVIGALNSDKPYDRFIIEQLAADKLPDGGDPSVLAALGFITVGERFKNPNDIINDRIDVVCKGFLAMTVTCARCHDHMFDPIPTKDYYALHGVFASTIEPGEKPVVGVPPVATDLAEYHRRLAELEGRSRDVYYKLVADVNSEVQGKVGAILRIAENGGKKGGSAENQKARNELLNRFKIGQDMVQLVIRSARREPAVFALGRALMEIGDEDFTTKAPEVVARMSANAGRVNLLVLAAFKDAPPASREDVVKIYEKLFTDIAPKLQDYIAARKKSEATDGFDPALIQLLETPLNAPPSEQLTIDKLRELAADFPPKLMGRTPFAFEKINELELTHPGAPARAMLVADAGKPKDSPVFIRGQAEARGEVVPRHFLEVLSPNGKAEPFKQGSGRIELAQAIASRANPLTARVMVNRVWMHHFGEGFVPTPDDLGTQSEPPSHPELLDFLANHFMDSGWSLKKLHRLIMLSRVYQESSHTNPVFETQDPQNRLLWRANIRRLDFEATRDSLLVFSGNLDPTVGGKPINLTEEPYSFRRSVYGYIDRGNLPEIMSQFDFSDPDMPNSKRASTMVPQQALFLMNSPMAIDVSRRILARPEVANAADNLRRVFAIYRVIFQRTPRPEEIQMALAFVGSEMKSAPQSANDPQAAKLAEAKMARVKAKAQQGGKGRNGATAPVRNEGEFVDRKPLTPWETYAQALLLSNEAAYVN